MSAFNDLISVFFKTTRFYKDVQNGYIVAVGTGETGEEITEEEYNTIRAAMAEKPVAPDGYDYKLKDDLTWEQYELPVIDPLEEEIDDAEAYSIILGVNESETP